MTAALTAIAIQAQGGQARSFLGHQLKVLTDNAFTKARIKAIDAAARAPRRSKDGRRSPSSPASRASTTQGNITTLGRGGSDTSAVAIAAAISADACEIFTDVDGVYTTDPNVCKTARKIERISYEEMLELASLGAKVLQIRSVEVAMKYGVPGARAVELLRRARHLGRRRGAARSRASSSPASPTTRARRG